MDDTGSVVSMKPVETRLITGNADLSRKRRLLPINIQGEMRVNVKGELFLLFTIDIVHRRILWVDNWSGLVLRLAVRIVINDKAGKAYCNDRYCHYRADDGNATSFLPALALCFAANLLFTALFTQVLFLRSTCDLFAHLESTNFQMGLSRSSNFFLLKEAFVHAAAAEA